LTPSHEGRPFNLLSTNIFSLGNGVFETIAFALVYRFGEGLGGKMPLSPKTAMRVGLVFGIVLLTLYNGMIHAFFWIELLPDHFHTTPIAEMVRGFHIPALAVMLVGWCLCFWLTRDVWTVVFFHILVDVVLMVQVRPELFLL
jgi:hypothetical protein